jgi:hypothetical protein
VRPALDQVPSTAFDRRSVGVRRALLVAALPALVAATPVELAVHVASDGDDPAVDQAWIDTAVATANERLGPAGVAFTATVAKPDGVPAEVLTVAQRDALAAHAEAGTLHVFVVGKLANKDRSGDWINGVTWRYAGPDRGLRGRRYIVVARDALVDTLAHELGHFFGLAHATDPANLMMAPGRTPGATLDERQLARVRARAAAWARRARRRRAPATCSSRRRTRSSACTASTRTPATRCRPGPGHRCCTSRCPDTRRRGCGSG